ncbi:hypothetical protein NDA06_02530 [Trichocoleus sp. ST-U1]
MCSELFDSIVASLEGGVLAFNPMSSEGDRLLLIVAIDKDCASQALR